MKQKNLLILNGSIQGSKGNCGLLIKNLKKKYASLFQISVSHLKSETRHQITKKLMNADCLLLVTGTYWESWGSPMQKFFEDFTDLEATKAFVGKPAGFIVLCHSVGGKSVLSRMQANLNLFGCLLPPFCGMELSLVAQSMLNMDRKNIHQKDLWHVDDIETILINMQTAALGRADYQAWPVDKKNFRKIWLDFEVHKT